MFGDAALAFREFAMGEPVPLATIQAAVLEFLRGRDDVVLQGAQAVNAYVDEPRMTQDVAALAIDAKQFAEEIRAFLNQKFHLAIRVRSVQEGVGFRVYQVQEPRNRHLVDVRAVRSLPAADRISEILVLAPAALVASKVRSSHNRRGTPKSYTDLRDVAVLLLTFPELKAEDGPVRAALDASGASEEVLTVWTDLVAREIREETDEEEFE